MQQAGIFDDLVSQPLAARLRPETLTEYVGQEHLLGKGRMLRRMIEQDRISSMIFWGPPGVGKTTLAQIIARMTRSVFINFSAVTSGIKEIRNVMEKAEMNRQIGQRTIVFVDEIHRFNKAQQDAFLPFVEKGSIILIGATTENPSFEVNGALLSRCRVFVLQPLSAEDLLKMLRYALQSPRGFGGQQIEITEDLLLLIANFANGDARSALSTLEMIVLNGDLNGDTVVVTKDILEQCISRKSLLYDKNGEEHYNLISALHKSMRNSDPDAAVYWLARMLEAGEDPLYVARRVTPKSNAMEVAYNLARADAQDMIAEPVPLVIRNAPTRLMKELQYGKGYQYAHDTDDKLTNMQCLPDSLLGKCYYQPTDEGLESRYKERLRQIKEWKRKHGAKI